jgi:hypothetical protein
VSTPVISRSAIPTLGEPIAEHLRHLPLDLIRDLHLLADGEFDPEGEKWRVSASDEPQLVSKVNTDAEFFAWFRGEIDWVPANGSETGHNPAGHPFLTFEHASGGKIRIEDDTAAAVEYTEGMIQARNRFTRREGWDLINKAVPQRYRFSGNTDQRLTRASIKPWVTTGKNPPINDATQQSRIDNHLRQWPTDLKSLLIYGTYNTSKTTFAAAYVTDVITDRVAYTPEPESAGFFQEESFDACVWSINLNEWFDSYLNWRTRDHDDHDVRKPSITAAEIKETSERMQLSPVLWIEELDKVNFTDTNRNWLHTLV